MKKTYRAMQVSKPGVMELVERNTPEPGAGEVLLQVEACGKNIRTGGLPPSARRLHDILLPAAG